MLLKTSSVCHQLFCCFSLSINQSIIPQHRDTRELQSPFIYSTGSCKVAALAGYGMTIGIFFLLDDQRERQTNKEHTQETASQTYTLRHRTSS